MFTTKDSFLATIKAELGNIKDKAEQTEAKGNTKHPIYDFNLQKQLKRLVGERLDALYSLFMDIALETGERTSDIAAMRFSDVDFEHGTIKIVVSKQTKSAETRAISSVAKKWKNKLKADAAMNADQSRYMAIDLCDPMDVLKFMTNDQLEEFKAEAVKAATGAKTKVSVKKLTPATLKKIAELKDKNIFDDFIFSRRLMKSNRAKNTDGHITRQSVWRAFRVVFDFMADALGGLKLSAYSLRKTFAINTYLAEKAAGRDGVAIVCEMFGHSSRDITRKYLMLDSEQALNYGV